MHQEYSRKSNQVKEEKDKRKRGHRNCDSLSYNSSGHLMNLMRPYNPSTAKKTNSQYSLTQRSLKSASP